MTTEERLSYLETLVSSLSEQLALFGTVDPDLANSMLVFWLVTFISGHAAGRVVRWLSKV